MQIGILTGGGDVPGLSLDSPLFAGVAARPDCQAAAGQSGVMVALHGTRLVAVPLADACAQIRGVDPELFGVARTFCG